MPPGGTDGRTDPPQPDTSGRGDAAHGVGLAAAEPDAADPRRGAPGDTATGTSERARAVLARLPESPAHAGLPEGSRANLLYFDYRLDPVDLALQLVDERENETTACFQRHALKLLGQERYRKLLLKMHVDAHRSSRTMRNVGAILTVRTQRALEKIGEPARSTG